MNPNDLQTVLTVVAGGTALRERLYAPGEPAAPISVGTAAEWVVDAPGVEHVHLFLAFDGAVLHVASAAPSARVLLHGQDVGAAWQPVPVPAELRFGAACISVTQLAARHAGTQPIALPERPEAGDFVVSPLRTQLIAPPAPGALRPMPARPVTGSDAPPSEPGGTDAFVAVQPVRRVQSAQSGRLVPATPAPRLDPAATQLYHTPVALGPAAAGGAPVPRPASAPPGAPNPAAFPTGTAAPDAPAWAQAGAPPHAVSPTVEPLPHAAPPYAAPPHAYGVPPQGAAQGAQPTPYFGAQPAFGSPAPGGSQPPSPAGVTAMQATQLIARPPAAPVEEEEEEVGPTTLHDGGKLRQQAARVASQLAGAAAAPAPGRPPAHTPGATPSGAPAAGAAPGAPAKPPSRLAVVWRETSLVKKISLALLPIGAVGLFWPQPQAPAPVASSATAASTAAVAASAAAAKAAASAASAGASASAAPGASAAQPAPSASTEPSSAGPTVSFGTASRASNAAGVAKSGPEARPTLPTGELMAINAAFEGRLSEAATLYDRLAKDTHSQVFALAAVLARQDAVRKPAIAH